MTSIPDELTPSDMRMLRQLAHEVRLTIESATLGPRRAKTFGPDAMRHLGLLRELIKSLPRCEPIEFMQEQAWRAWLSLLSSKSRRKVWGHRHAFMRMAIEHLLALELEARALERRLWEAA